MWNTSSNYKNEFADLKFEITPILIKYVNNLSYGKKINHVQYGCEIDLISKVDTIIKHHHKMYLNRYFINDHKTLQEITMKNHEKLKNYKNYQLCTYKNFYLIVATDKNNNLKFGRVDGALYHKDAETLLKNLKECLCTFENFLPIATNKDEIIYISDKYNSINILLKDYPEYFV